MCVQTGQKHLPIDRYPIPVLMWVYGTKKIGNVLPRMSRLEYVVYTEQGRYQGLTLNLLEVWQTFCSKLDATRKQLDNDQLLLERVLQCM